MSSITMKSSKPKISFVIPVKNRVELLQSTLESLQKQTEPNWEAIIVDDHSSEDVEQVVTRFGDERLCYFKLPLASGVAAARNYGNQRAKADIVAVLDSDDLAEPKRAEVTLKTYADHNWDFFSSGRLTLVMETGETKLPSVTLPQVWDPELFTTNGKEYVTHSSVAYTKQAAMEIPYNSALPCLDDYDLITRFIVLGKKMYFTPEILAIWRRHPDTLTAATADKIQGYKKAIRSWRGWDQ